MVCSIWRMTETYFSQRSESISMVRSLERHYVANGIFSDHLCALGTFVPNIFLSAFWTYHIHQNVTQIIHRGYMLRVRLKDARHINMAKIHRASCTVGSGVHWVLWVVRLGVCLPQMPSGSIRLLSVVFVDQTNTSHSLLCSQRFVEGFR